MTYNAATYQNEKTFVHSISAGSKILLLLIYSICLFLVHSWCALGCFAVLFAIAALGAHLRLMQALKQLAPLLLILLFSVFVNSFTVCFSNGAPEVAASFITDSFFSLYQPVRICGFLFLMPGGCEVACFTVSRIILLVWASLVLTTTSSSKEIANALSTFLKPFERFGLPIYDIAAIVWIALRFIPETIEGFHLVKNAQLSRAASFDTGTLIQRLKAWGSVLIPLFVGLFRRAERLALAMDARCYGMYKPILPAKEITNRQSNVLLVVGALICVLIVTTL